MKRCKIYINIFFILLLVICSYCDSKYSSISSEFKTGFGSVGEIQFETTRNHGFFYMDTCEKGWRNYYEHYQDIQFEDDVILKCDDDIMFIDLKKPLKKDDLISVKLKFEKAGEVEVNFQARDGDLMQEGGGHHHEH